MHLKMTDVQKGFRIAGEKKDILCGIDLEVRGGEICSITGRSGCGKTTLLNVISGITRPEKGSVFINGSMMRYFFDMATSRRRNRDIGFIFQTFRLLNDETVLSNVLLPARLRGKIDRDTRDRINDILGKLKIYKYRKMKAGVLSGGQKQRVAIARALANDPGIILADEPTANLDKRTSVEIFDILISLKKMGKAVLIVTHKDYMHERSDALFTMENGRLRLIS